MLKKHGELLLADKRSGKLASGEKLDMDKLFAEESGDVISEKKRLIDYIPEKYKGNNFYILTLMFYAWVANLIAVKLKGMGITIITPSITGILIGILVNILGLIDRDPQRKGNMAGVQSFALMLSVLGGLKSATPQMVMQLFVPLAIGLALATAGIIAVALIVSKFKFIGYDKWISMAIGLNCFLGFPPNYLVTMETINALTDDEDEKQFLNDEMMPKMILGSVVTVSIVSVVVAGFMAPMLGM